MNDITPLNLEDQPKLFGLRYDQLIACLAGLIVSSQLYSWCQPIPIMGGQHDLRTFIAIFICLLGPAYSLITLNASGSFWDTALDFYITPTTFIPGADPKQDRFLLDEDLPDFLESKDLDQELNFDLNPAFNPELPQRPSPYLDLTPAPPKLKP